MISQYQKYNRVCAFRSTPAIDDFIRDMRKRTGLSRGKVVRYLIWCGMEPFLETVKDLEEAEAKKKTPGRTRGL